MVTERRAFTVLVGNAEGKLTRDFEDTEMHMKET
jgi:hypothetical protein